MTRPHTPADADTLNRLLPQSQCRECGFSGCLPYAQALAAGETALNLCAPGGSEVVRDLAAVLQQPLLPPAKVQVRALAWIDEAVCIGCTACIRACPVDAILGAAKQMHTVLADECTGCALCVAPCPVDCIDMRPAAAPYLPKAGYSQAECPADQRFAAACYAQKRYQNRQARLQRQAAERERRHTERRAAQAVASAPPEHSTRPASAFNPAALIAQAMARAQAQQERRTVPANHDRFRADQLQHSRQRAAYRRAQRDLQYGSPAEQAAAREWLRRHAGEEGGDRD